MARYVAVQVRDVEVTYGHWHEKSYFYNEEYDEWVGDEDMATKYDTEGDAHNATPYVEEVWRV